MRIRIEFDSATTETVREMAVALHGVGLTRTLQVGVNGPERWSGITPSLTPDQFAMVVARLVKFDKHPIADHLNALSAADRVSA
jgi:hypothetical protein